MITPNELLIVCLVDQMKLLIESIERLDKEIATRFKAHEDRFIFDSLPGAGPQLAPRLLVAFGSDRSRYQDAAEIQKYAGVAPVIEQSG